MDFTMKTTQMNNILLSSLSYVFKNIGPRLKNSAIAYSLNGSNMQPHPFTGITKTWSNHPTYPSIYVGLYYTL